MLQRIAKSSPFSADLGLLVIRLMVGWVFVYHGAQKLFGWFGGYGISGTAQWMESIGIPFPVLSVILAGGAEFLGGLAFLSGFGARLAAVPLVFTMLVAGFTAHSGFAIQSGGMEYTLVLAAVAAAIGLSGPGRYAWAGARSVDRQPRAERATA